MMQSANQISKADHIVIQEARGKEKEETKWKIASQSITLLLGAVLAPLSLWYGDSVHA